MGLKMSLQLIKKIMSYVASISVFAGVVFGGIQIYQGFDNRFDLVSETLAEIKTEQKLESTRTRLNLVDVQMSIAKSELRALERIDSLTDTELRQYRVLEKSLIELGKERSKILGSP
jgi:hypothetical protein